MFITYIITCGKIQRASIESTVITVFLFIDDNISLNSLLFFDIIFAILITAKNNVYWITSAMVVYTQLVSKIFESILKILIHVNADINSVIINVTRFVITIVIDFTAFNFKMKIDKINILRYIINQLTNGKWSLIK